MEIRYDKAFSQIVNFLETIEKDLGINYYLVGGILVSIYSELRSTLDIDFVVDLYSVNYNLESYIELLKNSDFFPVQDWDTARNLANDTNFLQFLDMQQAIKFDNYIIERKSMSKYKRIGPLGLKRRVRISIRDIDCWIASKEDFILSKLVYGGWQDFTDALGCWMRYKVELNKKYLEEKSQYLGVNREYNILKSGIDDPDELFEKLKSE